MANVVANGITFHVQRLRRQTSDGAPQPPGPVVVFLHGLVIDNLSSLYYSLANPVAQAGADAVLYDQRGHGLSERPPSGYRIEDSVADLGTLLDALEIAGPVHLVGHSYGASVALRAAIAEPARFASIVLIEPHCAESESHAGGEWVEDVADMLTACALALEHNPIEGNLSASERRKRGSGAGRLAEANLFLNGTTLIEDIASSPPFTDEELGRLDVAVLAVYGEYTDLPSSARKLAACVPNCRLEVLPGLGHSVIRDARDVVLAMVQSWLAEFSPAGVAKAGV
jgi:pimeloyl-ACP methyl ester carboxylesterase